MKTAFLMVAFPAAVLAAFAPAACADDGDKLVTQSRARWEQTTHGEMLKRILPPGVEARHLPEPGSPGARLTVRYCVQCHNLAPPKDRKSVV